MWVFGRELHPGLLHNVCELRPPNDLAVGWQSIGMCFEDMQAFVHIGLPFDQLHSPQCCCNPTKKLVCCRDRCDEIDLLYTQKVASHPGSSSLGPIQLA